jgi:hypothetical protein
MRKHGLCTALCLLTFAGPAIAADMRVPDPTLPNGGFFGGLGGSYNAINFGTQNVYAVGTSNTYSGGALVATGMAAGPANIYMPSQGNFAPEAQVGYFQHFSGSNWLWGAKFNYSYLGTTAATSSVVLPQSGAFTSGGTTTPFTGNALVNSYQTSINDQISMLLFVGRSFDRDFFYLGAGPTLSLTQTYLNGVTGFADINGAHTQITGTPTNLSSSGWVWGGAAQLGATYFLDPTWFLDVNYTYSMTANQSGSYEAPFTNYTMTEVGTLSGTSTGRVIAQALTVSINKTFSWGAH